ncbi:MAG: hypothetical protein AAF732_14560 [Pseudomonadota bacterium]
MELADEAPFAAAVFPADGFADRLVPTADDFFRSAETFAAFVRGDDFGAAFDVASVAAASPAAFAAVRFAVAALVVPDALADAFADPADLADAAFVATGFADFAFAVAGFFALVLVDAFAAAAVRDFAFAAVAVFTGDDFVDDAFAAAAF